MCVETLIAQSHCSKVSQPQKLAQNSEQADRVTATPQRMAIESAPISTDQLNPALPQLDCDWGEAIDVSIFYGRKQELITLTEWIVPAACTERSDSGCRLVALLGMGGMGKTALSIKLAQQIQHHFEFVIWRSLRNLPTLETLLADLIAILSRHQEIQHFDSTPVQLSRLIHYLKQHRCLLILDNVESILQVGSVDAYLQQYEGYGELFRRVGEENHQSCLLLTSREKPIEVVRLATVTGPIRTFQLTGLNPIEGDPIFSTQGISGSKDDRQQLNQIYRGNPLALKIVTTSILELFDGNIADFLQEGVAVFNGIRFLLDQQWNRLSDLEKQVMYWLAINRDWVTIAELQKDVIPVISKVKLLEALESLERRSLIERGDQGFTQQPVVMEYVTEKFTGQVLKELITETGPDNTEFLLTFHRYALVKANGKDYIRDSQTRIVLQPIADKLCETFLSTAGLQKRMLRILQTLRRSAMLPSSYAAGNLVNLMRHLNLNLTGFDFSNLPLWQADFRGAILHHTNFVNTNFDRSIFTQTCGSLWSVAFAPSGECLATGDTNCEICIWRIADGQLLQTLKGHTSWVLCVAWSPDGTLLASAGNDSTLRLWDSQTGTCLYTLKDHHAWVWTVAWSPDGTLLATGSQDQTVKLWDVPTGQCLNTLEGHTGLVSAIGWSLDGKLLVTGSHDRTLRFWQVQTGQCLQTLQTDTTGVLSIAWSPDGQILASASYEPTIQLWNIGYDGIPSDLTVEHRQNLQGHTAWVSSLAWSPDAQILASAACDATIRLWQPLTGSCLKTLSGHTNWIYSIDWSPDGSMLASGSQDQTLRLWDRQTGQLLKILQGYTNGCFAIAWNLTGQILAAAFQDQTIRLWHQANQQWFQVLQGHQDLIWSVAWSPDNTLLATGTQNQTIQLWDVATGVCYKILTGHLSVVRSLSWHPKGQILASAAQDQTVRLWDIATGTCLKTLEHADFVWSVAWSPDGQWLASSCQDQRIRFWDGMTGACCQVLDGHADIVYGIAWSLDRTMIASGSQDRTIKLWEVSTGNCVHTLSGHTELVYSVTYSPDGTRIASGSHDHTIRVWDCETGKCLQTFTGHTALIHAVAWHPDGQILISGSGDGTIRVWQPDTGDCLEVLKIDRPYEGMRIAGATGLTAAQRATLTALGAVGG